jgi:hypothetical protein
MFQFEKPGIADTLICITAGLLTISWFEVYKAIKFSGNTPSVGIENLPDRSD